MKRVIALLLALALSGASAMVLAQDDGYIAVVCVEDEISEYAYGYDHLSTLQMINALMEDPDNHGIFLYLNSPGGYLYESDELYEKLMRYKAQTGNGVYCYVGAQACSGAFYAAMAADYIAAGKMSEVGNVGVYLETISYDGLYEKLGIEHHVLITGENKLEGVPTLTDAQREIVMGRLEEGLDFFVEVIRLGRGMDEQTARQLTDGRIFTATQAKERGLIDAVMTYDEAVDDMLGRFFGAQLPMLYMEDILDLDDGYGAEYGTYPYDTQDTQEKNPLFDWLLDGAGARRDGRLLALRRE